MHDIGRFELLGPQDSVLLSGDFKDWVPGDVEFSLRYGSAEDGLVERSGVAALAEVAGVPLTRAGAVEVQRARPTADPGPTAERALRLTWLRLLILATALGTIAVTVQDLRLAEQESADSLGPWWALVAGAALAVVLVMRGQDLLLDRRSSARLQLEPELRARPDAAATQQHRENARLGRAATGEIVVIDGAGGECWLGGPDEHTGITTVALLHGEDPAEPLHVELRDRLGTAWARLPASGWFADGDLSTVRSWAGAAGLRVLDVRQLSPLPPAGLHGGHTGDSLEREVYGANTSRDYFNAAMVPAWCLLRLWGREWWRPAVPIPVVGELTLGLLLSGVALAVALAASAQGFRRLSGTGGGK